MQPFEQFVTSFLRQVARGVEVEYNESLKSFVIRRNSWFVRTIPVYHLLEAWEMST
jgi:hypothetical protein